MSKELVNAIIDCNKRMTRMNDLAGLGDASLNRVMWKEAYDRKYAAVEALFQLRKMHWTTSGDFSHLQSTPGVRF